MLSTNKCDVEKHPFYRQVLEMVHKKNRNCLIIVTGDTGTGKSYAALKMAEDIDPTFNHETIKERVVCHPKQFIDLVINKKDTLKTGSVIVMDEAGVSMASREWYSYNNKAIDYILQTFRYQRLIVIFTVPNMSFVDSHARRLFNYYVETIGVDYSKKKCRCKIYQLSYNKMKPDKPYRQYIRDKPPGKPIKIIKRFMIKKPSVKLANRYEKYSHEFKATLARDLQIQGDKLEKKHEHKNINVEELAKKVIANKKRYFKVRANRLMANRQLIEYDFSVGEPLAKRIKKVAEMLIMDEREGNVNKT